MMDDLKLFLARFSVTTTQYMADRGKTETGLARLIWARDYSEAYDKLHAEYASEEYSVSYWVDNIDITPAII